MNDNNRVVHVAKVNKERRLGTDREGEVSRPDAPEVAALFVSPGYLIFSHILGHGKMFFNFPSDQYR